MNCYFHVDQPAVAQCNVCGKGLCKECASKYHNEVVCDDCVNERAVVVLSELAEEQTKKERRFKIALVVNVLSFLGMMFVMLFVYPGDPTMGAFMNFVAKVFSGIFIGLIMGVEFAGFAYALSFVRKHVSLTGIFLIPFIGWGLVLFWFMMVLTIGMIIGPFQYLADLIRKIISLIKAKRAAK